MGRAVESGAARGGRGDGGVAAAGAGPLAAGGAGRGARRLLAVAGVALGAYVLVSAAIVWAFGVKELGYYFFDTTDIPLYFRYALLLARGARPYVDFGVEYPPLALSLFALAGPPDRLDAYAFRFAVEMFGLGALAAGATAVAAGRTWPGGRRPHLAALGFALGVAATGALLANRYDVAVAAVIAACLLFLALGLPWAAALALGLGFALKLVPAILLPLVLVLAPTRRAVLAAAGAFAAAAAAPFLPHLPEGLAGLAQLLAYHGQRPLQVESVLATPFWLGRLLGLADLGVSNGFGGQNVVAPGADALARASGVLGLAALALAYAAVWRRREALRGAPHLHALAAAAVLLAFLVSGKVLSPQFLVWLLPCVGLLLPARPVLASLVLGTMGLTQIEFPANYFAFVGQQPAAIAVVIARNVALLASFIVAVVHLWRIPTPPRVEHSP